MLNLYIENKGCSVKKKKKEIINTNLNTNDIFYNKCTKKLVFMKITLIYN